MKEPTNHIFSIKIPTEIRISYARKNLHNFTLFFIHQGIWGRAERSLRRGSPGVVSNLSHSCWEWCFLCFLKL